MTTLLPRDEDRACDISLINTAGYPCWRPEAAQRYMDAKSAEMPAGAWYKYFGDATESTALTVGFFVALAVAGFIDYGVPSFTQRVLDLQLPGIVILIPFAALMVTVTAVLLKTCCRMPHEWQTLTLEYTGKYTDKHGRPHQTPIFVREMIGKINALFEGETVLWSISVFGPDPIVRGKTVRGDFVSMIYDVVDGKTVVIEPSADDILRY